MGNSRFGINPVDGWRLQQPLAKSDQLRFDAAQVIIEAGFARAGIVHSG
jgi:hypothetical protein